MVEPMGFGGVAMRPELQLRDIATKSKLEIKFDEFAGKVTHYFIEFYNAYVKAAQNVFQTLVMRLWS
jgi:hypothetical protein